ncbi:MAG: peptidase S10, partial [Verrucomicrobiota bacterium]
RRSRRRAGRDLDSVSEAVRLYVTRNERWLSPKFLCGESYGALRIAGLAEKLQSRYGMYLNGLMMVSGVLDFDTLWGSDLAYVTFLPTLTEVAAYFGMLDGNLAADPDTLRAEVEAFAKGEYASALLVGARLPQNKRREIVEQLSRYTGLDTSFIEDHDLRIPTGEFRRELLKSKDQIAGRFDARVTGPVRGSHTDPSYSAVFGPFSATLKSYLRSDLNYESDLVYEILSSKVRPWDYKRFEGESVKATPQLAKAMTDNPYLKVIVNCGRHDLATPYFAIQHSLDQLDIAPKLQENIRYTFYDGGHMMYTIEESNRLWNRDLGKFITEESDSAEE